MSRRFLSMQGLSLIHIYIQVKPYNGKYKIYIVPDADMMTVQAQNALLKTIEEPPAYAVILLLTENANSLLPTICSRCVMLKLRNIKDQLVKRYLMEQLQVPDYKADVCTAFAPVSYTHLDVYKRQGSGGYKYQYKNCPFIYDL